MGKTVGIATRPRFLPTLLAALAALVGVLLLSTAPASAHAVVVSSQPGDRERLPSPPKDVSVTFSEAVSPELGGLTVLNAKGDRVDDGTTNHPRPEVLQTNLAGDLAEGTYVVNYRVISADGHPITGALVFSVGTAIDDAGASGVKESSNQAVDVLAGVGRFGAYIGGLLAAGLAFFAWFIHDQAADKQRLPRLVYLAAAVGLVGQLLIVVAQAALASGSGLGAILDASRAGKVLGGSLGYATAALAVGLVVCAASMKMKGTVAGQGLSFYGFLTVAMSYALWGHDTESDVKWLSVVTDVTHAATAALWFGGLVGLSIVLVTRSRAAATAVEAVPPSEAGSAPEPAGTSAVSVLERVEAEPELDLSPADTVGVVIRFSTMATISIVLLAMAGGLLAYLELGSLNALVSSSYGITLLVKLAIVACIAGLAVYNHFRLLPRVLGEDQPEEAAATARDSDEVDDIDEEVVEPDFALPEWRRLLQTVRLEALAIVAVLAVTAVLVNVTPGKTASGDVNAGPFSATKAVGKGKVELVISPAKAGSNAMHITFMTPDGRPADLAQSVTVEMALPDKGVAPISASATKAGVGHFVVLSTPAMSIAGRWTVTLVSRLGEFEQERTPFDVPISP